VDNFDLYLDPRTTPAFFLDQLACWLGLTLDETWRRERRRTLVAEAAELYRRRGTRWSLSRHLAIYAGLPLDDDQIAQWIQIEEPEDQPHHFRVLLRIPPAESDEPVDVDHIIQVNKRIIEVNKPAHTTYSLQIFLFRSGIEQQSDLEAEELSGRFRAELEDHGIELSENATITTEVEGAGWRIDDVDQTYVVRKEADALCIYLCVET